MLSRLSISGRIYGAFGVMILLLAMLLLVSMVGVQALSGTFSGYRDHVGQSGQINQVVEQLGRARLAFSNYNLTPGADNATRVSAELSALDTANRALAAAGNAEIAALGDNLSAYAGDVGAMIALDADLAVLKAEIETAGAAATDTLAAMIAAAAQSSSLNAKAAAVSGLAMQRLLQLRLAVNAMIQTPSPANHATSLTLAGQAQQTLGELRAIFFKAEDVAQVDAVTALLGPYTRSIDAVHDRLEQRLQLGEVVGQIDAKLALAYDGLMQAATEAQTALGAAGEVQASQIRLTALAAGAVALVVGLVFAVLIARWLSGSIRQMSGAIGRMAQGDFDVTMAGADQHNELGQIARSLEVFGANGRAVRDNEVQREADRDRAAQRQTLRDQLQVDVESVVAAALDGDFGRRIEARYGIADLDSFAGSVNALVATMARGLDETGAVLAALADGDLSRRVTGTYAGAFGRLKSDTNSMADGLSLTMTRLGQSSRALKLATGEILSGANDLSARTHRQAAAIEQTAAAIQKLSGTIIENADRASEVASRTVQTSAIADEGGQVMVNATAAMERISTSSAKISNIIGLIDDIAFQTNLLALNASVEAARAGDSGKGFAVVAVEVRRLAQSAANASADVKLLIEQSSREVSGGTRLVGDAAAKLAAIVVSVEHNAVLIQAISTSSQTQSAAVKAVAQSMRQMDEMTQSNAALVEQTNLSIGQTEAQAIELDGIVNAFSLGPDLADQRLRA